MIFWLCWAIGAHRVEVESSALAGYTAGYHGLGKDMFHTCKHM